MSSLLYYFLLFETFAFIMAYKCYNDKTENDHKPNSTLDCPWSNYCSKSVQKVGNKRINMYWCDVNGCKGEGCSKTEGYDIKCCCKGDLCNSTTKKSIFYAIVSVVFVVKFLIL
ncbi:hypothetical protein RB195_016771 [Necator americanus]|uniref:ET module n=1 Tax=Necator americanus TaxID=51031 RepID=A0ABR1C228_NECAM